MVAPRDAEGNAEYIDGLERKWEEGTRAQYLIRPREGEDGNERSRSAVEEDVERFGGDYDGLIRNATVRPDGRIVDHHWYTIMREQYENAVNGGPQPG
ncbi:hypothetical protein AB7C87_18500 [Natrarchaeobius sp. A-rgal3]|uniref:hypothetical protein n=1 Tax=Natrarchaeobius versutus TaxID=1679078 RepID=UPI00350FADF5